MRGGAAVREAGENEVGVGVGIITRVGNASGATRTRTRKMSLVDWNGIGGILGVIPWQNEIPKNGIGRIGKVNTGERRAGLTGIIITNTDVDEHLHHGLEDFLELLNFSVHLPQTQTQNPEQRGRHHPLKWTATLHQIMTLG